MKKLTNEEILNQLNQLIEENNLEIEYTTDDDGFHISRNGKEIYVGWLEPTELSKQGFTPVGWMPPIEMSWQEWQDIGLTLQQIDISLPWWIGDWLNFGEFTFGEDYAQAVKETGMDLGRLNNYKWIANAVDWQTRHETLSWSHHRAVAKLSPELQNMWLDRAEDNGWSVNDLYREMKLESKAIEPPDFSDNGDEPDEPILIMSPVNRLRYAMRLLLDRHLHVAPYDVDRDVVIQAKAALEETADE